MQNESDNQLIPTVQDTLFFSVINILIYIEYYAKHHAILYYSHRKLMYDERVMVENFLLDKWAEQQTTYYQDPVSEFSYLGVDESLIEGLNDYYIKNNINPDDKNPKLSSSLSDMATPKYNVNIRPVWQLIFVKGCLVNFFARYSSGANIIEYFTDWKMSKKDKKQIEKNLLINWLGITQIITARCIKHLL